MSAWPWFKSIEYWAEGGSSRGILIEACQLSRVVQTRLEPMERISEILFDLIIVLAPSMKSSAPVKRKIRHTSPFGLGGCQGPVFWAFISTLDSPSQPHI